MNKKNNAKAATDSAVRILFQAVSYFSVIALAAMVLFIFSQGIIPFIMPTAQEINLVAENIGELTVNGTEYRNKKTFIPVSPDKGRITIGFLNRGNQVVLDLSIDDKKKDPENRIIFPPEITSQVSKPEAYNYTITYPGTIAGLEQKIHISLPEPPYSVTRFIAGMEWRPVYRKLFGIFPMIVATLLSTLGAVMLGVPIAVLSSILIAEFLSPAIAAIIRGSIDLLAGIPSVVYGFFGLMIIVPLIQTIFKSASGSSLAAAVIVLAIMILPTVVAISITALKSVPRSYREGSLALGATRMQTTFRIVLPSAKSGIFTGIMLGTARAAGETMAVILVAGNSPQLPGALTDSIRTMTATIALEMGYSAGRHNQMLFSIGIILFAVIFMLNGIIMKLKNQMTEKN